MLRPFRISKTRCVSLAWNATNPTKSTPSLSGVTTVSKTVLPLQRGTQPIQRKVSKCVKRQTFFWIPWILRDYEHQSRSLCISCRANESLSFCADGLWFKIWGTEKSIPFMQVTSCQFFRFPVAAPGHRWLRLRPNWPGWCRLAVGMFGRRGMASWTSWRSAMLATGSLLSLTIYALAHFRTLTSPPKLPSSSFNLSSSGRLGKAG